MEPGKFIYGFHAILSMLQANPSRVIKILFSKTRTDRRMIECLEIARRHGIKVVGIERSRLDKMSGRNHQGIIATTSRQATAQHSLVNANLVLVLDGVTDSYNIGSCIRTAEAMAVGDVVVGKFTNNGAQGAISKASSGAYGIVSVIETESISMTVSYFRSCGFYILGTDHLSRSLVCHSKFSVPLVLVMGSEGRGISSSVRSVCHQLVCIPMRGRMPCLSVSVAAGILLYEIQTRIVS